MGPRVLISGTWYKTYQTNPEQKNGSVADERQISSANAAAIRNGRWHDGDL
jgi:hypothetical protein